MLKAFKRVYDKLSGKDRKIVDDVISNNKEEQYLKKYDKRVLGGTVKQYLSSKRFIIPASITLVVLCISIFYLWKKTTENSVSISRRIEHKDIVPEIGIKTNVKWNAVTFNTKEDNKLVITITSGFDEARIGGKNVCIKGDITNQEPRVTEYGYFARLIMVDDTTSDMKGYSDKHYSIDKQRVQEKKVSYDGDERVETVTKTYHNILREQHSDNKSRMYEMKYYTGRLILTSTLSSAYSAKSYGQDDYLLENVPIFTELNRQAIAGIIHVNFPKYNAENISQLINKIKYIILNIAYLAQQYGFNHGERVIIVVPLLGLTKGWKPYYEQLKLTRNDLLDAISNSLNDVLLYSQLPISNIAEVRLIDPDGILKDRVNAMGGAETSYLLPMGLLIILLILFIITIRLFTSPNEKNFTDYRNMFSMKRLFHSPQ